MIKSDVDLINVVEKLPLSKIGTIFFRVTPLKWIKNFSSPEGARRKGGRFNPPLELAEQTCGISGGFGFLYTATDPITCLFEGTHLLRGLSPTEHQVQPMDPSLLATFDVNSDAVLDLRNADNQRQLDLTTSDLQALDYRYDTNAAGQITDLQRLGVAVYRIKRIDGILTPSRFTDVIPSYCFDFFPEQVKPKVRDVAKVLDKITIAP